MIRTYLQCDLCGDKWDITSTEYSSRLNYPGTAYIKDCLKDGRRRYIIQKGKVTDDDRLERDDIDICDKCYNKIERLFYDMNRKGEDEQD